MRGRYWLALLAALPGAAFAWGDDCKLSAERTGSIDTAGAEKIVIRAGAGSLKVTGVDGARAEARGKAANKDNFAG